jgi:transglutaminase-like putative cysteine protease
VVTLAGVGAVGVTVSEPAWTPLWALLTVVGHVVSLQLRRMRVAAEPIFYPVMLLGAAVVLQQALLGSPMVGLETGLAGQSIDMATGLIVAMLAVLRTFTLVTNTSLLFSPVPPITMLALVGSSNPNAEVPLFFGLSVLSSLFITGYEAHLRRMARVGRPPGPVTFHLFAAWGFTLVVAGLGVLFPVIVQPILSEFSPFALPQVSRLQMMQNFTQPNSAQAPVGQGPITLSPMPVYEVYTKETGKIRTAVYSRYTGRDWRLERDPATADITANERVTKSPPGIEGMVYELYHFSIPTTSTPNARIVRQTFVTQSRGQTAVPASGEIQELWYPGRRAYRHLTGCMTGNAHQSAGQVLEVASAVREFTPEELRAAPPVASEEVSWPETIELPNSALEVKQLAQQITQGISNPYDKVQAIIQHIEKNCTYTLQEEVTPPGTDAAAHYLFSSKRGACDLAATATAVMCRGVGIPARVAVGYVLEEPLTQGGGFLVRQAHAHMWVEAFFPTLGWVPFDPAPPISAIKENLLTTMWFRLSSVFSKIGGGGLDALLLVVVVLATLGMGAYAGIAWFRTRVLAPARLRREIAARPGGMVLLTYSQALRLLASRGWRREGWMTAREFLGELRLRWEGQPEAVAAMETLTGLFEQAEYAEPRQGDQEREASAALAVLNRLAPRAPREKDRKKIGAPAAEGSA